MATQKVIRHTLFKSLVIKSLKSALATSQSLSFYTLFIEVFVMFVQSFMCKDRFDLKIQRLSKQKKKKHIVHVIAKTRTIYRVGSPLY